jgi:DNA-binding transcriptional ArsR family regulator
MGWVLDRLKEVPPRAVLKERIGLIQEKYDNPISELESAVSRGLAIERGFLRYHLDRLEELGLAKLTGRN